MSAHSAALTGEVLVEAVTAPAALLIDARAVVLARRVGAVAASQVSRAVVADLNTTTPITVNYAALQCAT